MISQCPTRTLKCPILGHVKMKCPTRVLDVFVSDMGTRDTVGVLGRVLLLRTFRGRVG